jgi:ABC-2 family transporter protein
MIWVAFRRHRLMLAIVGGTYIALAVWMVFVAHSFDVARSFEHSHRCYFGDRPPPSLCFVDNTQPNLIAVLLLVMPCVTGVILGGPLIAGELHARTNRLVWTQTISRTKWIVTKWLLVGASLAVATAAFQLVVQWWFTHVNLGNTLPFAFGYSGLSRIQPLDFALTGVVPVAYALFAFALGAALGAILRRTPWAVAGTVLIYGGVALLMVLVVRPNLQPQTFVPDQPTGNSGELTLGGSVQFRAWYLGSGYRYRPGFEVPAGAPSADQAGQRCQELAFANTPTAYNSCVAEHGLRSGSFYLLDKHYWALQWLESAIYLGAVVVLFVLALWSVRRWKA